MASFTYLGLVVAVGGASLSIWSLILMEASPGFFTPWSQGSESMRTLINSLPQYSVKSKYKFEGIEKQSPSLAGRRDKSRCTGTCIQGKNLWLFFPTHYANNGSKFRNNTVKH